jgi:hypothetical protein
MHIKSAHSIQLVASSLLLVFTISTPIYAASSAEAASPYKLNSVPEQIPQPRNLNPNTAEPAVPAGPEAYQLEYKFRSQTATPRLIKAELSTQPEDKPASPPVPASNQAIFGKLTGESLRNEKLVNQPFYKEIALAASAASLDPALVHAVIFVESRYRHSAISPRGAIGLMQVLPETAARYGIADPGSSRKANLKAGTLYLRDLMRMFDNRIDLALAAYNAGEGAVLKYSMRVPPYPETRLYVGAVMAKYNEWRNDGTIVDTRAATSGNITSNILPDTPRKQAKLNYLPGTRLASSDMPFAPNY